MNSVICTLFEGDYHFGLGALANSLYEHGFRGSLYAGYRGPLPPWVGNANEFRPAEGLTIHFIPLVTNSHLTNYKPDFMLQVWDQLTPSAESLFYFDPDITIKCRWTFLEEWVNAGIALCADVNPSMPANHPIRYAWQRFFSIRGVDFHQAPDFYFNGGFIGLKSEAKQFLHCWQSIQNLMAPEIGGLQNVNLKDRTFLFCKTDQDALNIATMVTTHRISPMGQDGMDFQQGGGGYVMSHAAGGTKPWKKKMLRNAVIEAQPPSRSDRAYYLYTQKPIRLYSASSIALKRIALLAAAAIGRYLGK